MVARGEGKREGVVVVSCCRVWGLEVSEKGTSEKQKDALGPTNRTSENMIYLINSPAFRRFLGRRTRRPVQPQRMFSSDIRISYGLC